MASSSSSSSSTTTTTTTTTITTTTSNNSQNNGGNAISTPEHFICPISGDIFIDPVFASDGQTYERKDISKWIRQKGTNATSPMTGIKLKTKVLTPNHSMKSLVAAWQQKNKSGI